MDGACRQRRSFRYTETAASVDRQTGVYAVDQYPTLCLPRTMAVGMVTVLDKIPGQIYLGGMSARFRYLETNPWISFQHQAIQSPLWVLLGEAYSKCQHLAGTPLQPSLAKELASVYLVKGAVATTAIEGNTLSEKEVTDLLKGKTKLPPSQSYLEQEVRNVVVGLESIDRSSMSGESFRVTTQWIKEQNALVLRDLEAENHVVPGEYTKTQLVVNSYRAAPPEDVPYLMDRLVTWLNEWTVTTTDLPDHQRFFHAFFAAVLGHLYIAWIHPFGDGNGRTARLLECAILAHSGVVPWVSSNLLSDHYNRTRTRYYLRLASASRDGDVDGFLQYAAQGYVDMLREQILVVQGMQRNTAWVNFVHTAFHDDPSGPTRNRRLDLALALPEDRLVSRKDLRQLTTGLAAMYAGKEDKTLTRDINHLLALGLMVRAGNARYQSNIRQIDAFKPIAKPSQ